MINPVNFAHESIDPPRIAKGDLAEVKCHDGSWRTGTVTLANEIGIIVTVPGEYGDDRHKRVFAQEVPTHVRLVSKAPSPILARLQAMRAFADHAIDEYQRAHDPKATQANWQSGMEKCVSDIASCTKACADAQYEIGLQQIRRIA